MRGCEGGNILKAGGQRELPASALLNTQQLWVVCIRSVQDLVSHPPSADEGGAHKPEELLAVDGCWGRESVCGQGHGRLNTIMLQWTFPTQVHRVSANWIQQFIQGGKRGMKLGGVCGGVVEFKKR